jgi:multiple sugar transport system substrate-binding protein
LLTEALENYKYFFDNGLTPLGTVNTQLRQYFIEGKVAMLLDGPWVIAMIRNADESIRDNLKIARVPFDVSASNTSHSVHMSATLDETERQLVWDFYQILLTDEMQTLYGKLVDSPPPKDGALTEELVAEKPYLKQLVEFGVGSVSTVPYGMGLYWNEYSVIVADAIATLVSNPANTVSTMLAELETELNDMLGY